jgi:uncharacterized protein
MEKKSILVISLSIILGILLGTIILGRSIKRFRTDDRFISVKGFSEREVKADFAVWTITTRIANNDLAEGSKLIEESKNKVVAFLLKNNIRQNEIILKELIVNDKKAQDYGGYNQGESFRFIIDRIIQVRSSDVDNILKVSRMTDQLLAAGVVINSQNQFQNSVKFIYTKLNDIKPEMLTEAIRNARKAGEQFTSESGSRLVGLRKASQGLFSIVDRDDYLSGQSEGGYSPMNGSDIYKKIRVVVNADYTIK